MNRPTVCLDRFASIKLALEVVDEGAGLLVGVVFLSGRQFSKR